LIPKIIDKEEGRCLVSSPRTSNMEMTRNSTGKEVKKPVQKIRVSRRWKSRFGKAKFTLRKPCPQSWSAHETLSTIFCSFLSLNLLRVPALKPPIMAEKEEVKTDEFD
jgi:hypothetical protein